MILVTGATGLLGNCCVREWIARGEKVRVLVRPGPPRRELQGLDVEVVSGELHDPAAVERAVAGCRAVIHSAALIHIGWTRLDEARSVNVEGTQQIAAACLSHAARLIFVSTVDTLPAATCANSPLAEDTPGLAKPECTYVVSKRESEQVVVRAIARGLDAIIVHPGFMLAPYDWKPSSGQMMLGVAHMPVLFAPRGTASVCDARDVAAAIASAVSQGRSGEHYILAGENIPYAELWKQMLVAMQRDKRVYRMGPIIPTAIRGWEALARPLRFREALVNSASLTMGSLHHAYNSSKAEHELGYRRRPLEQTLREAWEWLRQHHLPAAGRPPTPLPPETAA
jgi:dihydroflavonol-4-reductase